MADKRDDTALTAPGDTERGGSLLARISTQMVRAMKQYYGKGPIHAKSYMVDDLLFIVMRNGMTQAEQTMLDARVPHASGAGARPAVRCR